MARRARTARYSVCSWARACQAGWLCSVARACTSSAVRSYSAMRSKKSRISWRNPRVARASRSTSGQAGPGAMPSAWLASSSPMMTSCSGPERSLRFPSTPLSSPRVWARLSRSKAYAAQARVGATERLRSLDAAMVSRMRVAAVRVGARMSRRAGSLPSAR